MTQTPIPAAGTGRETGLVAALQRPADGHWVAAVEACMICGPHGYRQEGSYAICRNCAAAIPISTLGQVGGCNPIAVPSHLKGGELVVHLAALVEAAHQVPH